MEHALNQVNARAVKRRSRGELERELAAVPQEKRAEQAFSSALKAEHQKKKLLETHGRMLSAMEQSQDEDPVYLRVRLFNIEQQLAKCDEATHRREIFISAKANEDLKNSSQETRDSRGEKQIIDDELLDEALTAFQQVDDETLESALASFLNEGNNRPLKEALVPFQDTMRKSMVSRMSRLSGLGDQLNIREDEIDDIDGKIDMSLLGGTSGGRFSTRASERRSGMLRGESKSLSVTPRSSLSPTSELGSISEEDSDDEERQLAVLEFHFGKWKKLEERWRKCEQAFDDQGTAHNRADDLELLYGEGRQLLEIPLGRRDKESLKQIEKVCSKFEVLWNLNESDQHYREIFEDYDKNWFTIKDAYKDGKISPEKMQQIWNWREKVIKHEMLPDLEAEFGEIRWGIFGSTDLTSDIDVGVMNHGQDRDGNFVEDWKIMEKFNQEFVERFGQEAGIFFDVNLYASAPSVISIEQVLDEHNQKNNSWRMVNSGQDIGALMKKRRYMSREEFEENLDATLSPLEVKLRKMERLKELNSKFSTDDGESKIDQNEIEEMSFLQDELGLTIEGDTDVDVAALSAGMEKLSSIIKVTQQHYDEAHALYILSLRKTLIASKPHILKLLNDPRENTPVDELSEILKLVDAIEEGTGLMHTDDKALTLFESDIIEAAHNLEKYEDIFMAVNNDLYTEAMGEVRRLEQEIFRLRLEEGHIKSKAENTLTRLEEERLHEIDSIIAGLFARIPTLYAGAYLFANEAYLSKGAMKHIVDSTQSVKIQLSQGKTRDVSVMDWEQMSEEDRDMRFNSVKESRRSDLKAFECLQSFNEQEGDILKDLKHYGEKPAGYAYYRSSKYLERLLDALVLLQSKTNLNSGLLGLNFTAEELQEKVLKNILPVRKDKIPQILKEHLEFDKLVEERISSSLEEIPEEPGVDRSELEKEVRISVLNELTNEILRNDDLINEFVRDQIYELFGVNTVEGLKKEVLRIGQAVNRLVREYFTEITFSLGEEHDRDYFTSFATSRHKDIYDFEGRVLTEV